LSYEFRVWGLRLKSSQAKKVKDLFTYSPIHLPRAQSMGQLLNFIHFGFNTPRLAAHQVIPAKAGIQKKANWMPDQVRHDEMPSQPRPLAAG
jgi:hypothetical protein